MPRILLADDHPIVRRHVREALQSVEGWEVCGEAANGREAVALTAAQRPDVVVLDLSMPDMDGLQAARLIHDQFPETAMIILTMHEPFGLAEELGTLGVRRWIPKTDIDHLVRAIRSLSAKSPANGTPKLVQKPRADKKSKVPVAMLTTLERDIVQMLAQARSHKEIADALSLTLAEVEIRREEILLKLQIDSVFDLVHYALREKLIEVRGNGGTNGFRRLTG
jgi:DNA-binding NarL/FixJ family response regulator